MNAVEMSFLFVFALVSGFVNASEVDVLKAHLLVMEKQLQSFNASLQKSKTCCHKSRSDVAFEVFSTPDVTLYGNQVYKFDAVTLNNGKGYHAASGIFEAPVSGTYLFWASILPKTSIHVDLYKEGRILATGLAQHPGMASLTYMTAVKKGEKLWFQNRIYTKRIWGYHHSSYGGALIHER
ncbi:uncharacterized protein [Haliotis cracherodii]|uniref:uncharacterized protein n=1 Tax=Haliotis cracherodii TaxID=6455 RepID=UPI0039ED8F4B